MEPLTWTLGARIEGEGPLYCESGVLFLVIRGAAIDDLVELGLGVAICGSRRCCTSEAIERSSRGRAFFPVDVTTACSSRMWSGERNMPFCGRGLDVDLARECECNSYEFLMARLRSLSELSISSRRAFWSTNGCLASVLPVGRNPLIAVVRWTRSDSTRTLRRNVTRQLSSWAYNYTRSADNYYNNNRTVLLNRHTVLRFCSFAFFLLLLLLLF